MTDYKYRLLQEIDELEAKIVKLATFVESDKLFHRIPAEEQGLLQEQWAAMVEYHNVLVRRADFMAKSGE